MTIVRGAGAGDHEPCLAFCESSTTGAHTQWSPQDSHQVLWDLPAAAAPKPKQRQSRGSAGTAVCWLSLPCTAPHQGMPAVSFPDVLNQQWSHA